MPRSSCDSKKHFARCLTAVDGRPAKVTWKCDHCGTHVMSGAFKAATARVHLAALVGNGVCANLCTADDEGAQVRREECMKI